MMRYVFLVCLAVSFATGLRSDLPNTNEFEPTRRPDNPSRARDILGYDSFQRSPKSYNNVQYGNNWEQYETPSLNYNPDFGRDGYRSDRKNSGRDRYDDDSRRDRYDQRDYGYRGDSYGDYRRY